MQLLQTLPGVERDVLISRDSSKPRLSSSFTRRLSTPNLDI